MTTTTKCHKKAIPESGGKPRRLSAAQVAALRCIAAEGDVDAFYQDGGYGDYSIRGKAAHSALWFNAADKVTDSLLTRGLCTSDGRLGAQWELTDAGRAALEALFALSKGGR